MEFLSRLTARGGRLRILAAVRQKIHSSYCPNFQGQLSPELNPVENIWQYLRQNWLSNRVFDNYDAIIDTAYDAWRRLTAQPETITSIGMRDWAHIGFAS